MLLAPSAPITHRVRSVVFAPSADSRRSSTASGPSRWPVACQPWWTETFERFETLPWRSSSRSGWWKKLLTFQPEGLGPPVQTQEGRAVRGAPFVEVVVGRHDLGKGVGHQSDALQDAADLVVEVHRSGQGIGTRLAFDDDHCPMVASWPPHDQYGFPHECSAVPDGPFAVRCGVSYAGRTDSASGADRGPRRRHRSPALSGSVAPCCEVADSGGGVALGVGRPARRRRFPYRAGAERKHRNTLGEIPVPDPCGRREVKS
ncbi:hypothetical protein F4561_006054 [Lipingzhangella halophila]|uniref:Uncharacterized protein n=1 Tax=Lipingzhangella halophila TaxID=1783352 RepID=A0A7W7W6T2_9ACTN|nr:hypothetical protein [Lipingzhangella halophila]